MRGSAYNPSEAIVAQSCQHGWQFLCVFSFPLAPADTRLLIESSDIQFSTNIYSTEVAPNECLSEVRSLLSCPSKIDAVRNLQGNDAQTFVDFLDRVSPGYVSRIPTQNTMH